MNPDTITAELRDLKPPIEIPEPAAFSPYAVAGLALLILLLAAGVLWWWLARRKRRATLDPVSEALRELEATSPLLEGSDSERFAIAVSDVLRRYLERHLGARSVRQTTDEFLAMLAGTAGGLLRAHRDVLQEFLQQCDLVKFARGELARTEREHLQACARAFIEATARPSSLDQSSLSNTSAPVAA